MTRNTEEPWQRVIDQMFRAERTLPDDFWAVGATQVLAQLAVDIESRLTDEEMAVLIGTGAMLMRLGRTETMAGIRAALAIRGIKPVRGGQ